MSPSDRPPVRILIVDDHTLFRRGLTALLLREPGLLVLDDAADASQGIRKAQELQPDVILLDNHLPGVNGVDALPALREAAPLARILMLTVSEDENDLAAALRGGAAGYLLKTIEGEALAQAITQAMQGDSVVAPEMLSKLVAAFRGSLPDAPPTESTPSAAPPPPSSPSYRTHGLGGSWSGGRSVGPEEEPCSGHGMVVALGSML